MAYNLKEIGKTFKNLKKTVKGISIGAIITAKVLPIIIIGVMVSSTFFTIVNWFKEIFLHGEKTAPQIYDTLGVEDLGELIEIKGNDSEGYYWGFKDDVDEKLDEVMEDLKDNESTVTIDNKDLLKKMILAEVVTQYPDLGGKTFSDSTINSDENDLGEVDNFQGAIHLRRVTPDKEIGALEDVSTGITTQTATYVQTDNEGLGTKQDIDDNIKKRMKNKSMPEGTEEITYDDLSYLTIPYWGFDGKEHKGEMIVRKELADEVLLIFQELYKVEYPIYKMQLIDEYEGTGEDLDWKSIEDNNTSAFCYRNSVGGTTTSNHGLGQAIDINPLINPYIKNVGDTSSHNVSNECNYISRNLSGWKDSAPNWNLETAKAANIDTNTKIYEIFIKYGWTWGGDWNSPKDYQHFEKTDLTNVAQISSIKVEEDEGEENSEDVDSDESLAGDGKQYVIAIDAGHGPSDFEGYSRAEYYTTGTSTSLSGVTPVVDEWVYNRYVADAIADKLSIYSNLKIVRIGNTEENPIVKNAERVNMAKEAGADLYITIHYNGSENTSVSGTEIYYPAETGYSQDTWSMQLAEILAKTVSSSIGLENRGIFDEYHTGSGGLVIIKHSQLVGFPCVCVEGGYMSCANDVNLLLGDEGINRYAEGVAAGILEYLGLENKGYGQVGSYTGGSLTNNAGINSRIYDLTYVPKDVFDQHIEEGNLDVLKEFTIDEENSNKIIVATWSYTNGTTTLSQKTFQSTKTYTQNYTMPIEYLLAYYIDTRNKEFVSDLADLAINSEFVLAIQDNVTTTQIQEFKTPITVKTVQLYDSISGGVRGRPTKTVTEGAEQLESSSIAETVSTTIELTYADTWCVKFYKDISYNSESLDSNGVANRVNTVQIINGNVSNTSNSYQGATTTDSQNVKDVPVSGSATLVNRTTTMNRSRTRTQQNTITYRYNTGEKYALGNEQKFITIYKKNEDFRASLKPEWLFKILDKQDKTANMIDLTKYLIYLAKGQKEDYGVTKFDFSNFMNNQFTDANSQGQIPLHTPVLSKDDFVKAMQEASNILTGKQKTNFDKNFLPYAADIYDWSCEANINPELVIVTALNEGGFGTCGGNYNYWGLNVPNGASSGDSFSSLKEGIEAYSAYIAKYEDPNRWFYAEILARKEARIAAGVDPLGYGDPGTLSGQQSIYSDVGKHVEGNSGTGGYYYLDPSRAGITKIYASHEEFLAKCKESGLAEHAYGTKCTDYECGQFTAWQVEGKIKSWNKIFGNYGSLYGYDGTGNQQVVEIAKSKLGCAYVLGAKGPNTFDCSGFVWWVYKQIGISVPGTTDEYKGYAGSAYEISWEEAQPGDILLVFNTERGTTYGHAGIYLGNDEYIHAPQTGDVVKISSGAQSKFKHVFRFK